MQNRGTQYANYGAEGLSTMTKTNLFRQSLHRNYLIVSFKVTVEGLEKERDFYFGKLRDIEVMCQEVVDEGNPLITKILDVLYATEVGLLI